MPVYREMRTGRWFFKTVVKLPDGTRRRISGRPGITGPYQDLSNTKTGATEAERRGVAAIMNGRWPGRPVEAEGRPSCPTFEQFAKEFYMPKMKTTGNKRVNKPATIDAKESHLRHHLVPRFGSKRLDEIDDVDVEDLKLGLARKGRSPKTINNVLTTLRNILVNSRKRKLIAVLPEIEWQHTALPAFDYLRFDECERLIAGAVKDEEWSCAVLVAVKTGLRLGELRALRWEDVDLVARKLHVRVNLWRDHEGTPKNGRTRMVGLPASAVAALQRHRHLRSERVFVDLAGRDYSIGTWRYALKRACLRAGLRVVGWHVLRHTYASHLAMRGEALTVIRDLMGHGTIAMTLRYAHLAPAMTQAAVAQLDEPAPAWSVRDVSVEPEKLLQLVKN
jgi:integrase